MVEVTAIALCARHEWRALGLADGSVRFTTQSNKHDEDDTLVDDPQNAAHHGQAHAGPVTAVAILRAAMEEPPVQTCIGCSASDDQTIVVWDLNTHRMLHRLLTANSEAVTALALELLHPDAAVARLDEPSVLVLAGSADGGVQVWVLSSQSPPALLACWRHSMRAPIRSLAYMPGKDGDATVVSIASKDEDEQGIAEEHSTSDWTLRTSAVVSEDAILADTFCDRNDEEELEHTNSIESAAAAEASTTTVCQGSSWDQHAETGPATLKACGKTCEASSAGVVTDKAEDVDSGGAFLGEDSRVRVPPPALASRGALPTTPSDDETPRAQVPKAIPSTANFRALGRSAATHDSERHATSAPNLVASQPALPRLEPHGKPPSFDAPHRILALTKSEHEYDDARNGVRALPLWSPALQSTAQLHNDCASLAAPCFTQAMATQLNGAALRQAQREASPLLNSSNSGEARYGRLTALEPSAAPRAVPSTAREGHHAVGRAMHRADLPLDHLSKCDREAELIDTRTEAALPPLHRCAAFSQNYVCALAS